MGLRFILMTSFVRIGIVTLTSGIMAVVAAFLAVLFHNIGLHDLVNLIAVLVVVVPIFLYLRARAEKWYEKWYDGRDEG